MARTGRAAVNMVKRAKGRKRSPGGRGPLSSDEDESGSETEDPRQQRNDGDSDSSASDPGDADDDEQEQQSQAGGSSSRKRDQRSVGGKRTSPSDSSDSTGKKRRKRSSRAQIAAAERARVLQTVQAWPTQQRQLLAMDLLRTVGVRARAHQLPYLCAPICALCTYVSVT